jgi:hypothetical protein
VIPCALKVTALQALPHGDTRVHVALPAALGGGLGSLPIKHVQCALLYPVRSVTVPSHRGASYVNVNLDDGRVLRAYATEERARQAALTAGHLFGCACTSCRGMNVSDGASAQNLTSSARGSLRRWALCRQGCTRQNGERIRGQ